MENKLYNDTEIELSAREIEDSSENDNESIYYTVSSYGADYSVDGIVKRLEKKQILVPSFQRSYVWDIKKASRFIESLILGLPVPGVFLSRDPYDKKNVTKPNAHNRWAAKTFKFTKVL